MGILLWFCVVPAIYVSAYTMMVDFNVWIYNGKVAGNADYAILVQSIDVIHWLWFCLLENNRKHCYQGVYFSQALAYCKKQAYLNINFKICRYGWANIGIDPKNCWRTFGAIIHHLTCIWYWHFQSVRNAHFLFVGILLGNKVFDIRVCWSILFWSGPTQTLPSLNKMDSDTLFMLDFTQNILTSNWSRCVAWAVKTNQT